MKKRDVTIYYGISMATYSIGYVALSAFSSLFLLDIGLSNGGIGILLAVASFLSVLFQPIVGQLIDHNPKVSSKLVLLSLGAMIMLTGISLIIGTGLPMMVKTLIYGLANMLLMLAQPFYNALGVDAINHGYGINLGIGRSLGSGGYALGSYGVGYLSVMFGPKCIPVIFTTTFFLLAVVLFLYPVKTEKDEKMLSEDRLSGKDREKKENPFLFLLRYKQFAVILLGLICVYFSHSLINTFALQIVLQKGGTSQDMGTASAIAACCELVTAIFFVQYMKVLKLSTILKISTIFFVLKTLFSLLVTSVTGFFLIQSLQMFGWGFLSVGIVYYVNNLMGDNDKAQGQAYAGMSYTIACVLATSLGGNLIDLFGVNTMLGVGTGSAVIGMMILWFSVKNTQTVTKE